MKQEGQTVYWTGEVDITAGGTILPQAGDFVGFYMTGWDAAGNQFPVVSNSEASPIPELAFDDTDFERQWVRLGAVGPELRVQSITVSDDHVSPGTDVEITATVINNGGPTTQQFKVAFFAGNADDPFDVKAIVGIEGGAASDVFGEQVQWSDLGIVIGFSLTGDSIPAGEGLLTNLWIQGSAGQTEACLTDVVISDSAGGAFDEVTVGDCVNVEDTLSNTEIPNEVSLSQNYPNPFNPVTNIDFSVDVSGMVTLKVYDISGKEVSNLVNDYLTPGNYSIKWNATDNFGNCLLYTSPSPRDS